MFRYIAKILGIFDILTAIIFWVFGFFNIGRGIILFFAVYLLVKGAIFLVSQDIASIGDVVCSIIIFASLGFTMPKLVVSVVSLFLLQKGIFSLF